MIRVEEEERMRGREVCYYKEGCRERDEKERLREMGSVKDGSERERIKES